MKHRRTVVFEYAFTEDEETYDDYLTDAQLVTLARDTIAEILLLEGLGDPIRIEYQP